MKSDSKKQTIYFGGVIAMFIFLFILPNLCHPWAPEVTQTGVTVALIFVGTIIGLLTTNDCILSALFSMCALVYHGVFTPAAVITAFIGNSMVWQVMLFFALSYIIVRDGTGETIARFILTRKVFQKRPLLMITALMVTLATAAVFIGVFGALIICFILLKSICAEAEIDPSSQFGRLLYLGCFISTCVGVNIMGKMNALHWATAQFFIDANGIDIPAYAFSLYSIYLLAAFIVCYILALKFIFRCDMSKLSKVDLTEVLGTENTIPTKKQLIPLVAFLIIAVYTFFSSLLPDNVPVISNIKGMENIIFTVAVLAVLALIRIDHEPILNLNEAFSKGVNWPICLAIGSLATLGGQLLADDYGIKAWLIATLGDKITSSSPLILLAISIVLSTILTNFFSNTAIMFIMSALVASLCAPLITSGYNVIIFPVAISTSAQLAYLTYASSGQATLLLGEKNMSMKFIWTSGLILLGIWMISAFLISALLLFIG